MMEQWFFDVLQWYASNSVFVGPAIGLVAGVFGTIFGTLIFGRDYKRRIKTLENGGSTPTVNVSVTVPMMWPIPLSDKKALDGPEPADNDPED